MKYIRPSRDLGTFLCFERSVIEKNIVLGYNDAMKFYGKYCGAKYTFNFESDAEPLIDRLSKEFTDTMSLFETEQLKELPRLFARNAVNAPCTQLISELYNGKPLDRRMYFIGALEITASVFGIEPDSVYTFTDITGELIEKTAEFKSDFEGELEGALEHLSLSAKKHNTYRLLEVKLLENNYDEMIAFVLLKLIYKYFK